jgi:hypothetical protein
MQPWRNPSARTRSSAWSPLPSTRRVRVPRNGRFEAIVVGHGTTDGTGDEAGADGAADVVRMKSAAAPANLNGGC